MINNFPEEIINCDKYLFPNIKISPFNSTYLEINENIFQENQNKEKSVDSLVKTHLSSSYKYHTITVNGREAIELILMNLDLSKDDEICIYTTSSSKYISGCVTNMIDKFCNWNRKITNRTKAIYIIHEFGYVCNEVIDSSLPIIEDCAYYFYKRGSSNYEADYVLYSLSKEFPVQYGGILLSKHKIIHDSRIKEFSKKYISSLLVEYIGQSQSNIALRKRNFNIYKKIFEKNNLCSRFECEYDSNPYAFVIKFDTDDEFILKKVKKFLNNDNIECSVYYNSGGFFLPNHYNLSATSIAYIANKFLCYFNLIKEQHLVKLNDKETISFFKEHFNSNLESINLGNYSNKYIYYIELENKFGKRYNNLIDNNINPNTYDSHGISCLNLYPLLKKLNIQDNDSIIDVGSGRGFALSIFSLFNFKNIAGIEISEFDYDICKMNLKNLNLSERIKLFNIDGIKFNDYDDYTHFYFNNPFPEDIFEIILLKIISSKSDVTIIYKNIHDHDVELLKKYNLHEINSFEGSELFTRGYKTFQLQREKLING